jgi:FixJ family two-component response regulator
MTSPIGVHQEKKIGLTTFMSNVIYMIDPTPAERTQIIGALANEPMTVMTYCSAELFLDQVTEMPSGCVLAPCNLPGMGVRGLISEILRRHLPLAVVVIGRQPDLSIAVELVRAGATDFLEQPFSDRQLRLIVRRAIGNGR